MEEITLTELQRDALQELANIGAGNASTALSQMVNKTIQMEIPKVDLVDISKVRGTMHIEDIVVGVFMRISREIPSYVLLLIPERSAFSLAGLLTGDSTPKEMLSELDQSAIQEVANVMICAFFNSISEMLGMSIMPDPPKLAYDILDAVIDYVLIQIGQITNELLVFDLELKEEEEDQFTMHMCLLPEPNSIKTILEKLNVL